MSDQTKTPPGDGRRDLFLAALEKTDPAERAAFLDQACAGNPELRRFVEELLGHATEMDGFLDTPALSGAKATPAGKGFGPGGTAVAAVTERSGDRIGRYKLLQKIGEGGVGVVYMAEQQEPVRRRIALKILKLGMDTRSVIARFEAERQALAMMEHSNIARVLDAGATEAGRPFFVMELVRGLKITEYCDQNKLPMRERLALFVQVCQAIQHAHQKGIIHRDIKPSNILVTSHDGVPVPKVIDFGIAKATEHRLTDKTLFTEFSSFIGTPAYMSPEQAEMSGLDIDTRSDIYSLGVLLYELLTGKTPFDGGTLLAAGLDECRRTIREQEPVRPSTRLETMVAAELTTTAAQRHTEAPKLIHGLRRDLDWIVMTCLEKDRTRRYATAHELALDVQRYLSGEAVQACPPSNLYRFQKFVRRHRGALGAAAAIVVTLLTGVAFSTWLAVRATRAEHRASASREQEVLLREQAERERARAEQERASARLNEYVADINLAQQSLAAGNYGRAVQLLGKHRPEDGATDLRGFEWRYLWRQCQGDDHTSLPTQESAIHTAAFSPAGDLLAVGLRDKIVFRHPRSGAWVTNLDHGAISMAFFPDGKKFVSASPSTVRVWNTDDWSLIKSLPENSGPVALSRDATRLAVCSREGVRLWDTATWKQLRHFPGSMGPVAFSPDGKTLATDTFKAGLTLWPLADSRPEVVLTNSTNLFGRWFRGDRSIAFSPDGRWVVAARNTLSERGVFVLSIWDARSGREETVMPDDPDHIEHTGSISGLAFSPDGQTLATMSLDHSIRLWNFPARQLLAVFQGHLSEVWTAAFSPDGQSLVSGAKDGGVKMWPLQRRKKDNAPSGGWEPLAFAKDSRLLAAANREGGIAFFNIDTREPERQFQLEPMRFPAPPPDWPTNRPPPPPRGFPPKANSYSFSADLGTYAQGMGDGTVILRSTVNDDATTLKVCDQMVDFVALAPDARALIAGARFQALRWWDLRTGTNFVLETEAHRAVFSPDGRTFAAFPWGNTFEIWDGTTRVLRLKITSDAPPGAAAFSPDSRLLAAVCGDDSIRLWDAATGRLLGACTGHKQGVHCVAFSPDGRTLATASDDSTLKIWNVATQQELLTIRRLGGTLHRLVFSPDGTLLAGGNFSASTAGSLRFYPAPLAGEIDELTGNAAATSAGIRLNRPVR